MSEKAKAIQTLYRIGRLDKNGVAEAVKRGLITEAEYEIITGEIYL